MKYLLISLVLLSAIFSAQAQLSESQYTLFLDPTDHIWATGRNKGVLSTPDTTVLNLDSTAPDPDLISKILHILISTIDMQNKDIDYLYRKVCLMQDKLDSLEKQVKDVRSGSWYIPYPDNQLIDSWLTNPPSQYPDNWEGTLHPVILK